MSIWAFDIDGRDQENVKEELTNHMVDHSCGSANFRTFSSALIQKFSLNLKKNRGGTLHKSQWKTVESLLDQKF